MRSPSLPLAVVVLLLSSHPAPAQSDAVAQARASLDAIEAEVPRLKRGDAPPANALLQRCHQVRQALIAAVSGADAGWTAQLKRCEALDRRIQEAATGQPKPMPAADEPTRRAVALLDEVEAGLAALGAGDTAAANALVAKLDEAKKVAVTASAEARRGDAWIETLPRAFDLDKRVRARYAEKGAGVDPAALSGPPRPGERPPAAARALSVSDAWALRKDFYPVWDDVAGQLERVETADLGLSRFAERFRDAVRRMLAAIQAVGEQGHPDVAWCRHRLAAFNTRLEERIAAGVKLQLERRKAEEAAGVDVNARLAALREAFDPATLRLELAPPYSAERVQAWVAEVKTLRQVARAGQAEMEAIRAKYPRYAKDPAVDDMHRRFASWLPAQLAQATLDLAGLDATGARRPGAGKLSELIDRGEASRRAPPSDADLANDAWVAGVLRDLREGAAAAEALRLVQKGLFERDDPALGQQAAGLRAAAAALEERGQRALAGTRMPAAASTDPGLVKLARDCLANPEYGVGPYERLVITSAPTRQTAKRSDRWVEGDYLYIRTWTEEWEEMYVVLAEKTGEHHRLVTYVLKLVHRSAGMKPEGRWYVHERWEGARILPEHIGK